MIKLLLPFLLVVLAMGIVRAQFKLMPMPYNYNCIINDSNGISVIQNQNGTVAFKKCDTCKLTIYDSAATIDVLMQLIENQLSNAMHTEIHDTIYFVKGELIQAALFCIGKAKWPTGWDFHFEEKINNKPSIKKLVVAGAFYMAENDRIGVDAYQPAIDELARKIDQNIAGIMLNPY